MVTGRTVTVGNVAKRQRTTAPQSRIVFAVPRVVRSVAVASALLAALPAGVARAAAPEPSSEDGPSADEAPSAEAPPSDPARPEEETPAAAAGQLVPPTLTKDVQPIYPARAEAEGIAAAVVVDIDIDASGNVEGVSVAQSAEPTGYGFDEAAIAAAEQLKFEPARVDGEAVPVRIGYRFGFEPRLVEPTPVAPPEPDTGEPAEAPPSGELWGTLKERGTRLPLVGIKVTVFRGAGSEAEGFETETDGEGSFRFNNLGVGVWRVLADPEGYYPVRETESLHAGERTSSRYLIERRSYNKYDVIIESQRVHREVSRSVIDARQAERIPGTFGDVLGVVQSFPGVARTVANQLVVRGSAPEDSKVFLNGAAVPLLYHFGNLRSVMPAGMVENVQFYSGNFSVEYGRVTGGIVDIELRDLQPKKVGGYADLNIFDGGAYLQAPLGEDFALAVSARRSYIDLFLGAGAANQRVVQPRYFDVHTLASYRPNPKHHARMLFMFSGDRRELYSDEQPDTPEEVEVIRFFRTMAEYRYVPSDRFENELKVSFGRDWVDSEINVALDETDPFSDIVYYQTHLRDAARVRLGRYFALRGGVDLLLEHTDQSLRMAPAVLEGHHEVGDPQPGDVEVGTDAPTIQPLTSSSKGTAYSSAAFAELEITPHETTLLLPGLRLDHFSRTDEFSVSPRFTARQKIGERWAVKGGVGLFTQEPPYNETDASLGNPDLGLEKAMHYSAGVVALPRPHINLGVTGFYKTLHNLVSAPAATADEDGPRYTNGGEGRVIGMEVSARHRLTNNFFGWLSYTLSKAERRDDGAAAYRRFDHDQTHILTLIGSYQLPRNWEIGTRFRFVSGNLYTPVVSAVYDADAERYVPVSGAPNSDRHKHFHQLDLRIDKRWIYKKWTLNAYLDIQNVYSRREEATQYSLDYSQTTSSPIGLPILPILGVRGEF